MNTIEAIQLLTDINERGPHPAQYGAVTAAVKALNADDRIGRNQLWDLLIKPSRADGKYNFVYHIMAKPYGYAGDFALMDKFYEAYDKHHDRRCRVESCSDYDDKVSLWDQYTLSLPCAMCLYYREQYLLREIGRLIESHKVHSVLDIACGGGRLLTKLADKYPGILLHGIDVEEKAVGRALIRRGRFSNPDFEQMNALANLPKNKYDLVVSAGLCDYLTDDHVRRLAKRIQKYNQPRYIILGNMTSHKDEDLMAVLDWKLIYRTGTDLVSAVANDFTDRALFVGKEPIGVNLFLHIEPKG